LSKPSAQFRSVDGILLFDKPQGMTSNQALQRVRHLFKAAKAGHTGSLDPLATGVLPICFGEATKFSQFLLHADKTYQTRAVLGVTTDSADADGQVLETRPVPVLTESVIQSVLARFTGAIEQVPPMYSAVKLNGKRLYKSAREGLSIEREARQVTIHALQLLAWNETFIDLRVTCSKGTYIRTLVEDIGEALGCGAHVGVLRREQTAIFDLAQAHTLEDIRTLAEPALASQRFEVLDSLLLPTDGALQDWQLIELDNLQTHSILRGQTVTIQPGFNAGLIRIQDVNGRFIGIGEVCGERLKPQRLVTKTD
jgi:tRNA pseudouridine55 synthase